MCGYERNFLIVMIEFWSRPLKTPFESACGLLVANVVLKPKVETRV